VTPRHKTLIGDILLTLAFAGAAVLLVRLITG